MMRVRPTARTAVSPRRGEEEAAEGRADEAACAPGGVEGRHNGASPARLNDARVGVHRYIHEDVGMLTKPNSNAHAVRKPIPGDRRWAWGRAASRSAVIGPE